jgi:hypothetical protein
MRAKFLRKMNDYSEGGRSEFVDAQVENVGVSGQKEDYPAASIRASGLVRFQDNLVLSILAAGQKALFDYGTVGLIASRRNQRKDFELRGSSGLRAP